MAKERAYVPPALRHESGGVDPRSIPPGWDENPTNWPKRIGLAVLALLGFLVAGYLLLYQLEIFKSVWDPFFDSPTGPAPDGPVPGRFVGCSGLRDGDLVELYRGQGPVAYDAVGDDRVRGGDLLGCRGEHYAHDPATARRKRLVPALHLIRRHLPDPLRLGGG